MPHRLILGPWIYPTVKQETPRLLLHEALALPPAFWGVSTAFGL